MRRIMNIVSDVPRRVLDQATATAWRGCTAAAAWTRALIPAPVVPFPSLPDEGTFIWHVQPDLNEFPSAATWYTDGSAVDGQHEQLRRLGWAFVAIDAQGDVVAATYGSPPPWIDSVTGAEAWALMQASKVAGLGATFVTDSLSCAHAARRGVKWATAPSRPLARVWRMMLAGFGSGAGGATVVWMPAHTAAHDIGVKLLSNGVALTRRDQLSNALADELAKRGAHQWRASAAVRARFVAAHVLAARAAVLVGHATWHANNAPQEPCRDSAPAARPASRCDAEHGGFRGPLPRSTRAPPTPRPPHLGGHALERAEEGRWTCRVCRKSSTNHGPFAAQRCGGSAAARWAAREAVCTAAGRLDGPRHSRWLTGSVIWCARCGAYADDHAVGLAAPCKGPPPSSGGRRTSLSRLRRGIHPKSNLPLEGRPWPEPSLWRRGKPCDLDGTDPQQRQQQPHGGWGSRAANGSQQAGSRKRTLAQQHIDQLHRLHPTHGVPPLAEPIVEGAPSSAAARLAALRARVCAAAAAAAASRTPPTLDAIDELTGPPLTWKFVTLTVILLFLSVAVAHGGRATAVTTTPARARPRGRRRESRSTSRRALLTALTSHLAMMVRLPVA